MSEPATQAMLWDVAQSIRDHIDTKHKGLRDDLTRYHDDVRTRLEDHESRLVAMKTEKDTEDRLAAEYRADRWNALRYRAMVWGTVASLLVTISLFVIDRILRSHGWLAALVLP